MKKTLLCFTVILFSMSTVQAAPDTKRPDLSKLCQGKAINSVAKVGGKKIAGKCDITFKSNTHR